MNTTRYLPFVGRLLIGLPFMMSGVSKIMGYDATIQFVAYGAGAFSIDNRRSKVGLPGGALQGAR